MKIVMIIGTIIFYIYVSDKTKISYKNFPRKLPLKIVLKHYKLVIANILHREQTHTILLYKVWKNTFMWQISYTLYVHKIFDI